MSPVARSGGTLPHYQLGDLGLIPRPKNHIPTSVDKMRVLSATTRLGGLRKVLTKSVAVQTVSAPKVCIYVSFYNLAIRALQPFNYFRYVRSWC